MTEAEKDALIRELAEALRFYADERRYRGPNQQLIENDPFTPDGAVYMQDTCRDVGAIARAALAKVPK